MGDAAWGRKHGFGVWWESHPTSQSRVTWSAPRVTWSAPRVTWSARPV